MDLAENNAMIQNLMSGFIIVILPKHQLSTLICLTMLNPMSTNFKIFLTTTKLVPCSS